MTWPTRSASHAVTIAEGIYLACGVTGLVEGNRTALALRTVSREGELGPIVTVAENAVSQPLDVPEAVATGNALLVTWTDSGDGGGVRVAQVENLH